MSGITYRIIPTAALLCGAVIYPKRTANAEEIRTDISKRKPIYDSDENAQRSIAQHIHDTTITPKPLEKPATNPSSPTPTDRIAQQVRHSRLWAHKYVVKAEDGINNTMTRFLQLESDFASTIASLAPPRGSNEKLLTGSVYVLVAAMAGSIISRNRNLLLRTIVPLATGITTSYYVLPITTHNVEKLIWKYEERYPLIRDNHLRAKQSISHFVETGKAHSQMGLGMAREKVQGVGDKIETWISQGR